MEESDLNVCLVLIIGWTVLFYSKLQCNQKIDAKFLPPSLVDNNIYPNDHFLNNLGCTLKIYTECRNHGHNVLDQPERSRYVGNVIS